MSKRVTGRVGVGLIQMRCSTNPNENVERALGFVDQAAGQGAKIVCLPELFRSLYFCQEENHDHFKLAEPIPGPTTELLQAKAREHKLVLVGSLFEKRAEGLYHNTAIIIGPDGGIIGKYRKMHIPDDPLYYEKFYFAPGDLGFRAFETPYAKIGVCVCWDQWYPEAARLTALQGAQILFYPTAIGWHPDEKKQFGEAQIGAWETIQRSHAIANGVYVAVPNRTGHEAPAGGKGIDFWGNSFVADPAGTVLKRASREKEELLITEIDLASIDEQRTHWPFLRDRRIDAYQDITRRMID